MPDCGRDPAFAAAPSSQSSLSSPSGLQSGVKFDPELIAQAVSQVEAERLAPIIRKAAEEFYCTVLDTAEDHLRDNLDWNLKSHLSMLERENQQMRTQLREVDQFICPPWCSHEQRIEWLSKADRERAQLIELRYAVQFDPERAKALAAAASGGDVKQAPGEAPQSGPQGNAQ